MVKARYPQAEVCLFRPVSRCGSAGLTSIFTQLLNLDTAHPKMSISPNNHGSESVLGKLGEKCGLIALLLLKWLHHLSQAGWSLSNLASLLRLNLFTYRDLENWLNDPFETPPLIPGPQQLALPLAGFGQEAAQNSKQTST